MSHNPVYCPWCGASNNDYDITLGEVITIKMTCECCVKYAEIMIQENALTPMGTC